MKRLTLVILVFLVLAAGQVLAQDANVITLDDNNPSVSAKIDEAPNTTGVVAVDVNMASVTLTDANGEVVFLSADSRVHHLELRIAPNSGDHTLTIQRLAGVAASSAQISAQVNLTTANPTTTLVDTNSNSAQQHSVSLDAANPSGRVVLDTQPATTSLITANFPGDAVMAQLSDSSGGLIATSSRDIDGFNVLLDSGQYALNVQTTASNPVKVAVSAVATNQFAILGTPQAQAAAMQTSSTTPCTATISTSSVNLRSGPGTGYSVLSAASQGAKLAVGGLNPEQNWLVVGTDAGSGWIERDLAQMSGGCGQLQTFNILLRDAPTAQVIVQNVSSSGSRQTATTTHHEDDNEHEANQNGGGEQNNSGGDD